MMKRAAILLALVLAGCSQGSAPAAGPSAAPATPIPFSDGEARTLLLRSLLAQQRGDAEAVTADLFPREMNVARACARVRLASTRSTLTGLADDDGKKPEITSVDVKVTRTDATHFQGRWSVPGTSALGGVENFVHAQGRWWIECAM